MRSFRSHPLIQHEGSFDQARASRDQMTLTDLDQARKALADAVARHPSCRKAFMIPEVNVLPSTDIRPVGSGQVLGGWNQRNNDEFIKAKRR